MSRSAWTHTLCDSCWEIRSGDRSGIFIREDPAQMRCRGVHKVSDTPPPSR